MQTIGAEDQATTRERINREFEYHPPDRRQLEQYRAIREAGKYFATVILMNTPAGADQSAAIRKVREAVMTANAAIACEPKTDWQNLVRTPMPAGGREDKRTEPWPPERERL